MSQCHVTSTEVTLNPSSHADVTFDFHALPVKQQEFLKKGIRINLTEHRPFTKLDFKHMSDANWRKFIQRTKPHLELVINSHPRSWKVKGIILPGDSHRVTLQDMRVGLDFLAIVESLKLTSPAIPLNYRGHRDLVKRVIRKTGLGRKRMGSRYDIQLCHGFRKRFNTILKANKEINSNIAEKLMGHKNGLDGIYFVPSEEQCFVEFCKAIPDLTINDSERDKVKIAKLEMKLSEKRCV